MTQSYGAGTIDNGKSSRIIGLDEFILLVCRNDNTFQEILIDELKLAHIKDLNLPSSDIILSVTGQYNFALDSSSSSGIESGITLSRLFHTSGTKVQATYGTAPAIQGRSNSFTASIIQPIAKNAFGYINRIDEKILDIEIDVTKFQIVEAYEDYLASLIALYYEWYSDYENLNTARISLNENTKLLEQIRAKKNFNIAYQSDVDKIELQLIEKKENFYSLEAVYSRTMDLVNQASGNYENEIRPEFSVYHKSSQDYANENNKINRSRTYIILSLIEEKGDNTVKRNVNALLPSLDGLFGFTREQNNYTNKEKSDTVFAGVSFNLESRKEKRAALEISRIEKKKNEISAENLKKKLEYDLKNIRDQIELETKLIESSERKIRLGERIAADETKQYQRARASLTDVINAVNDLEQMKYGRIYHTVKCNTLKIELLRLTDRLVTEKVLK